MKWASVKMKVLYALLIIGTLVMAAGADSHWS